MQATSVTKNTSALPTYIFARVANKKLDPIRESLEDISYVDWFGSTTGRFDIAIALKGCEPDQVYSTITRIRDIDGVEATTTYTPFDGFNREPVEDEDVEESVGHVLMRTQGDAEELLASLRKIPEVSEVLIVPGEWDAVATVRGATYEDILRTSVEEISQIDGVSSSETSFVYQLKSAA